MADLENRRRAVERILEDESLTADLTDKAARTLLGWGVARAKAMAQQAKGSSQAELDAHLADLRRTMKRLSRRAGEAAPEVQAQQVRALLLEVEQKQNLEVENGT
jgi:hypothetical protein